MRTLQYVIVFSGLLHVQQWPMAGLRRLGVCVCGSIASRLRYHNTRRARWPQQIGRWTPSCTGFWPVSNEGRVRWLEDCFYFCVVAGAWQRWWRTHWWREWTTAKMGGGHRPRIHQALIPLLEIFVTPKNIVRLSSASHLSSSINTPPKPPYSLARSTTNDSCCSLKRTQLLSSRTTLSNLNNNTNGSMLSVFSHSWPSFLIQLSPNHIQFEIQMRLK